MTTALLVAALSLPPYLALAGGSAADMATTLAALHDGRGQEANPLLSHGGTVGLIAVKSASTAGTLWIIKRLADSGHSRIAKIVGYGGGAALTALAAHNARVNR